MQVLKPDLESVHNDACELREEVDKYNKQKHEMLLRAKNHRELGAKMFYFAEVDNYVETLKLWGRGLSEILKLSSF